MSNKNKPPKGEIYGQYAWDNAQGLVDPTNPDPTGTRLERGDGSAAFHIEGLWDEENTKVPDEATGTVDALPDDLRDSGLEIVSDGEVLGSERTTREISASALDDLMGMTGDDTARWLAENDPNR